MARSERNPARSSWTRRTARDGRRAAAAAQQSSRVHTGGENERLELIQALEIVDGLHLDDYQYLHSTRGELLRRLGRSDVAREAFDHALALARSARERRFLERRIAEL